GFTVAPETMAYMSDLVEQGGLDRLTPERQWHELSAALVTTAPRRFLEVLRDCGALAKVFPEIDALFGVPQPIQHHPEVDTGLHTLLVLDQATALSDDPRVRFAALVHDLGKARTPVEELPRHIAHDRRGLAPIRELCERLRAPVDYRELALAVCREHLLIHRVQELRPKTVLSLLERLDAFRRPSRVEDVVLACRADCRGRPGREDDPYPRGNLLLTFQRAAAEVGVEDLLEAGKSGPAVGDELRRRRIRAIARLRSPP
ncbi:MAG TPA: multifunctional CCA tRNA nucleotidyl transferase/2'3'-cyclic phosphodiesterase/2'nucleotidase/phosphatase, partial [Deltaproteobacteria bacterium]|nr:multifunctional CCA tRNA nucleotidyl transferase/2'3'-cyclic phosphodiesterase/2'nucleotidase/phosphatase [Deltaproteobacteria bacterium]